MREIKAWDKRNKQIKKVWAIDYQINEVELSDKFDGYWTRFEDVILLQYTGLKDKNGVEIYEGDIVTSKEYPFQDEGKYNYHGVVEWDEDIAAFSIVKRLVNSSRRGILEGIADSMEDIEYFEIIGNIYENQELLEEMER